MLFIEDALAKMELLDPEVIFIINSDRFLIPLHELAEKYKIDLDDSLIFLVTGDLKEEDLISYLIQEKEMAEADAKVLAKELSEYILKPLTERLIFFNSDPDRSQDSIRLEQGYLKQIFAKNFLAELTENVFIRNALNFKIFDLLERDFNFKMELERALYDNQELLTTEKIKISQRLVEPSVGNWLKDFIHKKGNENFDTVVLSDYLANSENAKNLNMVERVRLAEVLLLYKNLRFFEIEVKNKPIDDWRIFPVSLNELKKKQQELESEDEDEPSELSLEQKLATYDWDKMSKLEILAVLEELGVSQKDFNDWKNSR